MQTGLVILAAGLGTRYKGELKQTVKVYDDFTLMDISIQNALQVGFNRFVIVVRKSMTDFVLNLKEKYSDISLEFVYQDGLVQREKPLGTAHALYVTKDVLSCPFCLVNADNYYDIETFSLMYDFLTNECSDTSYAMIGYMTENTLSKKGVVNRGICDIKDGYLTSIREVKGIDFANYPKGSICSVGMFGFSPSIYQYLGKDFTIFLETMTDDNEFMLPSFIENHLGDFSVKVLITEKKFFELTYVEDLDEIKNYIKEI